MMKYGEHLKNLGHHVSCLNPMFAGEMCFFWCGGPRKSLPTGLSGPDARDLRAVPWVECPWWGDELTATAHCSAPRPLHRAATAGSGEAIPVWGAIVLITENPKGSHCLGGRSQLDGHSNHLGENNFRRIWMDQKDVSST